MPTKFTIPAKPAKIRKFKTEGECVDWLHSPEGREAERQHILKALDKPLIEIDMPITSSESIQIMKATGARLHVGKGFIDWCSFSG